jgi:DNA ligase-1
MKTLPTLYSRTSTGATQQWTLEIEGDKYRTTYGQIDGKKTTTQWYSAYAKNEGRANATTPAEQALIEAQACWKKKSEQGYFEKIEDIDDDYFIDPMKAQKYEDRKDELVFPVYSQPKLDGIRCVISPKGMQSREGKYFKSAPHIMAALEPFFEKYPDVVLDGELYCDKLANDFNKICSLVKKSKPTDKDILESARTIQYWVYDIVDTTQKFSERKFHIIEYFGNLWGIHQPSCIVTVPTHQAKDHDELKELYENYIEAGYEGQMVRTNDVYQNKRSKYLLKDKCFQDAEYDIVQVMEGEGNKTGMAGYMVMKNTNGSTFKSNIKGNRAYLRELLINAKELAGKKATVKYFNLTPDGVPRFPYVIAIRDYEN